MSRNITDLHPRLQAIIPVLIESCRDEGLIIGIGECMRTVSEQDALYAQGRTAPGNRVTNARGSSYSSMHQWGVAFDFYRNDGAGAYNEGANFFNRVGAIGKNLGLEWGGDWKSIVDKPHFQLPDWGSTATVLKNTYGTPEKFKETWEFDDSIGKKGTVQLFTRNGSDAQKWIMEKQPNGAFHIKNVATGLYLDVAGGSTVNGTEIQVWECNSSLGQQFFTQGFKDGVRLRSALDTNKCVDIEMNDQRRGVKIELWDANASDAQFFKIAKHNEGFVEFLTTSGLALDVAEGKPNGKRYVE